MERVKKYIYRAAIVTASVVALGGYIATGVIYKRIEDLERQLHDQEQRIQQFEKMRVQVNLLEEQVNAATQSLEQYEIHQMNGNGSHYKQSLENHLDERRKK